MKERCPVCFGAGNVEYGFYGDKITGSSSTSLNPREPCRTCNGVTFLESGSVPVSALRALVETWRNQGEIIDSFHATMGIGYKVCAKELAAMLDKLAPPAHGRDQMTEPITDHPIAVLLWIGGYETIIDVPEPPPPTWRVPIAQHCTLPLVEPPAYSPRKVRTFELAPYRSSVRFWRVYNEGRSMTPEPAYVYFERAGAHAEGAQP